MQSCDVNLSNSQFINLHANKSAGAVGIKRLTGDVEVYNCTFINTTSKKNGGALFIDRGSASEDFTDLDGEVTITDSLFENCSSQIAGAYVQFDGNITINNTVFINNRADYAGAAVYTTYANLTISNTTFKDNKVYNDMEDYSDGGAL